MDPLSLVTAIAFSVGSVHIPRTDQNQINPGIHVEMEDYRVGVYYNSNRSVTAYVGYSLPLIRTESVRIGALVALGSGYSSPVIGGIEVRVGEHLSMLAVPKIAGNNPATVGFAVRFPI